VAYVTTGGTSLQLGCSGPGIGDWMEISWWIYHDLSINGGTNDDISVK